MRHAARAVHATLLLVSLAVAASAAPPPPSPASQDLLSAALRAAFDEAKAALQQGADVNAADAHGATPALRAAANGHHGLVEYFLALGADVHAADADGYTALHYAAFDGHSKTVGLLLERGAKPGGKDRAGRTPLEMTTHRAARKDSSTDELLRRAVLAAM